jgi:hypothetical protein
MSCHARNILDIAIVTLTAGLLTGTANCAGVAGQRQTAAYSEIPLSFEPNQGQTDPSAQFISHGPGYSLFLGPGEAYVTLERQAGTQTRNAPSPRSSGAAPVDTLRDTLRMKLLGADSAAAVTGLDRQAGVVNYFIGNDPKKWRSGIPTYGKVSYTAVYPGIDLVFYGNQQQLEYDFVVAPGADPGRIQWQIEGAALSVDRHCDLQMAAPNGPASFKKPVLYQRYGNQKVSVNGRYVVAGNQVRFALGAYDHSKPLIIDPVLSYLTYLGGAVSAYGPAPSGTSYIGWTTGYSDWVQGQPSQGLAIDREGDVYVTGNTNAIDFPVKDPVQSSDAALKVNYNATSAYVTKFNPEGTGLIYSTYLSGGGQFFSKGTSIAVDAEGNAYAAGWTDDPNYPTTPGAFQKICGAFSNNGTRTANCEVAGPQNGFVTKLDPSGSKLVYSTLLGANQESLNSIAVDTEGRAYVAGVSTDSCGPPLPSFECYPTTAGAVLPGSATGVEVPGEDYYSGFSGFATLSVFSADGSSLLYSTLVGDNTALIASGALSPSSFGTTAGISVAVNASGEFFLTGSTKATKLPVTGAAYQKHGLASLPNQGASGFVAKFNPIGAKGSSLNYLTYLGANSDPTNAFAEPSGIAADKDGEAYVFGLTDSQYYPTTKGSYQPSCGTPHFDECSAAFVTKLNASGSDLVWSTMFADQIGGADGISAAGQIQLDAEGDVYIAGNAEGFYQFPQVNPIQPSRGNGQPFVAKLNPEGSKLLFSTLVGGLAGGQFDAGLAVDEEHNVYLAGNSNSAGGVETTKGAFQQKFLGSGSEGFVAKIAPVAPSVTKLTPATPNKAGEVLLTAKVTTVAYSPEPAGKVTFDVGSNTLGSASLNSAGVATYTVIGLTGGKHSFKASYAGDAFFLPSLSAAVVGTAKDATTAKLTSSANPSTHLQAVKFTVKVTCAAGVATGEVQFKINTNLLASKELANGAASYSTSALAVGTHDITAFYEGNATCGPSTSNIVAEIVKAPAASWKPATSLDPSQH